MASLRRIVIAGAGMAGCYAAETLRKEGFDGAITLVGAERHLPYDRPPLSKGFLRGEKPADAVLFHHASYYDELRIDRRLGSRLVALRASAHEVELDTGACLPFDKLLIATGGEPRRVPVPGADLPGVHYLRTLDDSSRIGDELRRRPHIVVVGAGFIGAEVAASARILGCEVTVIELESVPLLRVLGHDVGVIYADIHRDHGVDLRLGDGLAGFRGAGRVEEVVTASGAAVPCDLVVVGVGIRPSVGWLDGSGIEMANGVLTDEYCATSAPDVFAAGDLANWLHPRMGERLRVEHWDNAMNQGVAAARSMLGKGEPYAPVPYFWSDQYDLNLQYVGHASSWERVVVRGDVQGRSFSAFYLNDSRIAAALVVNRFKDLRPSRRLIEAMTPVDPARLADPDVDLRSLRT